MSQTYTGSREETRIVHGIKSCHTTSMDLVPPIHMTSTFKFRDQAHGAGVFSGAEDGFLYTRISNPTVGQLQEKIALLEGTEDAIATSSGMSAIASVVMTLARPGDNIVACNALYGGTFALMHEHLAQFDINVRFISPADSNDAGNIVPLVDNKTRLLYIETPANPTLDVIDIGLWASIAANNNTIFAVDNTFASSYLQKPAALGADIVVHSATKYLGGHGDIIGGIIAASSEITTRIRESYFNHFGPAMSPFNAWLVLRGLKTLAIRMNRHSDTAMKVAMWLENHPKVSRVYYPGLVSHPNHLIAAKQMKDFSGIIAFELKGGMAAGKTVLDSVKLSTLAVSLGDCETLIQHPASMTHSTYSAEELKKAGIAEGLIRLSVGLEHPDDIIEDLDQAM
ncbi:Methionine gamma-lyase [Desulfamplus magnetovallimortis]|uniref:Methionine gamma-lyase n=1 Tax=Desulfamplus magnetovallimortis TaxID=1246637 RepID=A0A1W1H5U9_9BACT|nr:aminotransferase class I/II-fold pyridoxal phosphate-dependent enzyme [Desulfamplus magnetovallimortis]SLM27853.1 Methionine gamma-lyase [Desulfamplus magnetovallimortis]